MLERITNIETSYQQLLSTLTNSAVTLGAAQRYFWIQLTGRAVTGCLERTSTESFGTYQGYFWNEPVMLLERTSSTGLELTSEVAVVILVPPAAPTTRTARPSLSVTMLGHIEDSGRFPPCTVYSK
jgi:hypothetical protein